MPAISKDIRAIPKVIAIVTGDLGRPPLHDLIVDHGARVTIADLPTSNGKDVAKELGETCTFSPQT